MIDNSTPHGAVLKADNICICAACEDARLQPLYYCMFARQVRSAE